jgi:hypothetical protein
MPGLGSRAASQEISTIFQNPEFTPRLPASSVTIGSGRACLNASACMFAFYLKEPLTFDATDYA